MLAPCSLRLCSRVRPLFRVVATRNISSGQHKDPDGPIYPEGAFAQDASFFSDLARRFIKFSALGTCALVAIGWGAFEGTQMWVEHVELAPDKDQDVRSWEWHLEPDNWGETDPALGYKGRHSIRAAWMAMNWGSGRSGSLTNEAASGTGGFSVVNTDLARANEFLDTAVSIAEPRSVSNILRPQTMATLLAQHGYVLERMNDALQAKAQYTRSWASALGKGHLATYVAARLGDINHRLGLSNDALAWWARAISIMQSSEPALAAETPTIPTTVPSSPFDQRILASILVSLSAFYATSGHLQEAQAIEEGSLRLLRSIPIPGTLTSATPAQALHSLFILHRASLLSIHLAEVLHSRQNASSTVLQWLSNAAESSERVALILADVPVDNTNPRPPQLISSDAKPPTAYLSSRSLRRPASNLLRDARRTAVEAWSLMGILTEDSNPKEALQYYERAILCAGNSLDDAKQELPESEWRSLHRNYTRLRGKM